MISNGGGYNDFGGPAKKLRTDIMPDMESPDSETIAKRRRLEKYHEQEQQLLLLQQQTQVQLLMSSQEALTQEQVLALQQQQQDLLSQQQARQKKLEQKMKGKRKIVDGMQCSGVVRSYGSDKYFGFISCPEVSNDVYFRVLPGRQNPVVGQRCTFQLKITKGGLFHAYTVTLQDSDEKSMLELESDLADPEQIDDAVLAAQVEQMQKMQEYQAIQQSMIAQQKQQAELIESAEAQEAAEAYKKRSSGFNEDLCGDFQSGKCTRGDKCMFSHVLKKRWCSDFQKGICAFGEKCRWLHTVNPRNETVDVTNLKTTGKSWSGVKTKMCAFYEQGKCQKGAECTYAHDPDEIGTKRNELVTMMTPLGPMRVHCPTGGVSSDAAVIREPPEKARYGGSCPEDMYTRLKKRIGWLNTRGGFGNDIGYDKVVETAAVIGLEEAVMMRVLQRLEDKGYSTARDEAKDCTEWVIKTIWKEYKPKPKEDDGRRKGGDGDSKGAAPNTEAWQQEVLAEYHKMMLQAQGLPADPAAAMVAPLPPMPAPAFGQMFQIPMPGEKEWKPPPEAAPVAQIAPHTSAEPSSDYQEPTGVPWSEENWKEIDDWTSGQKKPGFKLKVKPGAGDNTWDKNYKPPKLLPPKVVPKVVPRRVPKEAPPGAMVKAVGGQPGGAEAFGAFSFGAEDLLARALVPPPKALTPGFEERMAKLLDADDLMPKAFGAEELMAKSTETKSGQGSAQDLMAKAMGTQSGQGSAEDLLAMALQAPVASQPSYLPPPPPPPSLLSPSPVSTPGSAEDLMAKAFAKIEEDKIPKEETVFNMIIEGEDHGMTLDSQGAELIVREIPEGSQGAKWNSKNPDRKIEVGDFITEVNAKKGTPGELVIAMFALQPGRQHVLKIRRITIKQTTVKKVSEEFDDEDL